MQILQKQETFDFQVEDKKEFLLITANQINTKDQLKKIQNQIAEIFAKHKENLKIIRNRQN